MVITDDKESRQRAGWQFSPLNRFVQMYKHINAQTEARTMHASAAFHLCGVRGVI